MAPSTPTTVFLHLPREIRDLIYSFLIPPSTTYAIVEYRRRVSLPHRIFLQQPSLTILFASKTVQDELLSSLCATSTFRFSYPEGSNLYPIQPISQPHANLLQHVEIDLDLSVWSCPVLLMLDPDNIKRKSCRITMRYENPNPAPVASAGFSKTIDHAVGFETVVVAQEFRCDKKDDDLDVWWYVQNMLGPGSEVFYEGDAACREYHPRKYGAKWLTGAAIRD